MTPKTLQEVLAIEDIAIKIAYLKKGRRNPLPDTLTNLADWDMTKHDIMNPELYKKIKVLAKMAEDKFDPESGKTIPVPAQYEMKEPNRIALPIEQDIVNIQPPFVSAQNPRLNAIPKMMGKRMCLKPLSRYSRRIN